MFSLEQDFSHPCKIYFRKDYKYNNGIEAKEEDTVVL